MALLVVIHELLELTLDLSLQELRVSTSNIPVGAVPGFAWHVAAVSAPSLHDEAPLTVNPESQVGWQVDPDAKLFVQSPTPPLVGAIEASQLSSRVVLSVLGV